MKLIQHWMNLMPFMVVKKHLVIGHNVAVTQGFILKRPLKAKGTHIAFLKEVKAFFFVQFTAYDL